MKNLNRLSEIQLAAISLMPYFQDIELRALSRNTRRCQYRAPNPTNPDSAPLCCAFGQWIPDDKYHSEWDSKTIGVMELDENVGIDSILPERLRGYRLAFWTRVQNIHDGSENVSELEHRLRSNFRHFDNPNGVTVDEIIEWMKTSDYPQILEHYGLADLNHIPRAPVNVHVSDGG